ncbi:MAG: GNAT family N-acetyltransferase [Chloroflexi bacterium]|nr:GNAT family N-acetyltransferase [Chloroflexota bacterium]
MISGDRAIIILILKSLPEFTPVDVSIAEELIDSYLQGGMNSGYHILIAELASKVTGYVCYGPTPLTEGTWDVYWIAVAPEKQGHGVGHTLISFAEDKIRKAEGRLVLIETSAKENYAKTRRFYRTQGYMPIACIPDFYAPGDDKLILQKKLR